LTQYRKLAFRQSSTSVQRPKMSRFGAWNGHLQRFGTSQVPIWSFRAGSQLESCL
jgi:hypothetical protein